MDRGYTLTLWWGECSVIMALNKGIDVIDVGASPPINLNGDYYH